DFQESDELDGFFMQDATGDGNALTSDGIFVYATQVVSAGNWVEVTGTVDEYYGLTQLKSVSAISVISSGNTIAATSVTLPEQTNGDLERYEGMLVTIPHTMTVEQNYFQGRYGQVTLASGGRLYQPTNVYAPSSQAAIDLADENARRLLILDDGSSDQNPGPIPYIGADNTLRAGDVVSAGLTGVLGYGRINSSSPAANDYRLHPTAPVGIARVNARTAAPDDVGGRLRVASFNVLNYFNGDGLGGGFPTSRGADTLVEFARQRTKIITALLAMDADVVGLMEIENDGYDANSAIQDLVNGLNGTAGAGTYALIDPGVSVIGTDVIAVGLIYKPGIVTPVGSAAILDSTFDPAFIDTKNRPALAQTFQENATGARFTAVVNHLKSKGSPCNDVGDPDMGDGQGNCNLTRTDAMTVEVAWLATDPTGSGDPDFLIIGDLNSYAMEDPISAAKDAGYTDLLQSFVGMGAYSYVFDGQAGYLDHALANGSLTSQVTGATDWHINADEPSVIDYNTEFKSQDLYSPTAYRASDHDPVILGLDLVNQTDLTVTKSVTPTVDVSPGGIVTYTVVISNGGVADAMGVVVTDTLPPEIDFGGWVVSGSALLPDPTGEIVWGPWTIAGGETIEYVFTATLKTGSLYFDLSVVNPPSDRNPKWKRCAGRALSWSSTTTKRTSQT
ncbi:MAG: ExeM/NucH family extracellular endonuclease, partial [Anaerolineae bacterium]